LFNTSAGGERTGFVVVAEVHVVVCEGLLSHKAHLTHDDLGVLRVLVSAVATDHAAALFRVDALELNIGVAVVEALAHFLMCAFALHCL
jgi:hypothetical protein